MDDDEETGEPYDPSTPENQADDRWTEFGDEVRL
jgi:hypothetical protein